MLALFLGACENPSGGNGDNGDNGAAWEAADNFYLEHSAVLELPADMITLAEGAPVDAALEAYAGLSGEAQALLTEEKAHLDLLKEKIAGLAAKAEDGAYYTTADLGAHLAAQPDNTADAPYPAVYVGNERPKALYRALAAGGKYVDLNLAQSGVQGFNTGAEKGRDLIVSLTLPDSLTEIRDGEDARYPIFNGFMNLKSVSAANVVKLGAYTFANMGRLETVNLPKAAVIGESAFDGCTALTAVEFPQAETLNHSAFRNSTSLATVTLPQAGTLYSHIFWGCTSLTTVILGETPPTVNHVLLQDGTTIFSNIFRDTATAATAASPKTITFKVPDPAVYIAAGTPWSDKIGANKDAGYYWDFQGAGKNYLTVALEAL
jgi:hypothetical protein